MRVIRETPTSPNPGGWSVGEWRAIGQPLTIGAPKLGCSWPPPCMPPCVPRADPWLGSPMGVRGPLMTCYVVRDSSQLPSIHTYQCRGHSSLFAQVLAVFLKIHLFFEIHSYMRRSTRLSSSHGISKFSSLRWRFVRSGVCGHWL